jgi:hypothetical protein
MAEPDYSSLPTAARTAHEIAVDRLRQERDAHRAYLAALPRSPVPPAPPPTHRRRRTSKERPA